MATTDAEPAPSITAAVERVLSSGQRVLVDRIELLRIEAKEDIETAMRGAALSIGGAVLLFYGWIVIVAGLVYVTWGTLSLGAALALAAAFHVFGGAMALWLGTRTLRGIRPLRPDDPLVEQRDRQTLGKRGPA